MKTYLFLSIFISSLFTIQAQNSTIVFNHQKGLNANHKKDLSEVYHNMNGLTFHYFKLVSKVETENYNTSNLLQKVKARVKIITNYYVQQQGVSSENLVVIYGGQYPILSLYKAKAVLTASGTINLEANDKQCYDFNTAASSPIISNYGTKFYFPPNAFETLDGKQVVNSDISICLWEFTDKKSLVYSGVSTAANGKMLETAGSFYIEANFNGKELKLRLGNTYTIEMSTNKKHDDMFTYYGGKTDGTINWNISKNELAVYNEASSEFELDDEVEILQVAYDEYGEEFNEEYYESEQAVNFYELSAGKLGWINCDRFYEIKNPQTLAIKVNSDQPLVVRLVFRGINSVLPAYSNSNHKDQYEAEGIPKGEKVLLLAYSVKDDNAVFGYKEITIGENKIENITLNNLSKSRFKGAVSELLSY